MKDALLPAERSLVELGEALRVEENWLFFQNATAQKFIGAVEQLTGRTVRSFASATDAKAGVVSEIFVFEPDGAGS